MFLLTTGLPQIFSYITAEITLADFYLKRHDIFKSVKISDGKCTNASATVTDPYTLNINTYLISLLFEILSNSTREELYAKGIFVVPYGVLIAYDSKVLNDLNTNARDHYSKESTEKQQRWLHLSRQWSKQGYLLANGKNKVYAWHKVICSGNKYLVYGLILKFNVKRLRNFKRLLSNAVPLGEEPLLIDNLLKNYGTTFPGILSINNDTPQTTEALKVYDEETDKDEILITPIFGKGIKEREEDAQNVKALKKRNLADEKEQGILDANEVLRKNDFALSSALASENLQISKFSGTGKSPIFTEDDEESSSIFSLPEDLNEDEDEDGRIDLAASAPTDITKQSDLEDFYEKDLKEKTAVRSELLLKDKNNPYKTTFNFPKAVKADPPSVSLKLESWLTDYNSKLVKPTTTDNLENTEEE